MSLPLAILSALHQGPVYRPQCVGQSLRLRTFTPNFDVHETPSAYILDGELPGLSDKSALRVEFSDNQTLIIEGRVDRPVPRPTSGGEGEAEAKEADAREDEKGEKEPSEKELADEGQQQQAEAKKPRPSRKQLKVWVTERSVGSFRRVFHLPSPVDTDDTRASLEHGVLRLVVPKKVVEKRRIVIE